MDPITGFIFHQSQFCTRSILREKLLNNPTFLSRVYLMKWFLCVRRFFSHAMICFAWYCYFVYHISNCNQCYLSWALIYELINSKIFFSFSDVVCKTLSTSINIRFNQCNMWSYLIQSTSATLARTS